MTGLIKPTIILILVIVITAGVLFAIKIWIQKKHDVSLMGKYLFGERQVFKSLVFSLGSIVIF